MTESWDKLTRLTAIRSETLTQWQEHSEKMKQDFKSDVKPIPVTMPQSKSENYQGYRRKEERDTGNRQVFEGRQSDLDRGNWNKDEERERKRSRDRENRPKYDAGSKYHENRDERRNYYGRNEDVDRRRESLEYRRNDHYRMDDDRRREDDRKMEDDRKRDQYRRNDRSYSNGEKRHSGSQDRYRNRDYGKDDEHSHKNTYKN